MSICLNVCASVCVYRMNFSCYDISFGDNSDAPAVCIWNDELMMFGWLCTWLSTFVGVAARE
jgi:hypothetical protein